MIASVVNIPVLYFSYEPDRREIIIPPEAYASFKSATPIFYGQSTKSIGMATLRRVNNKILATMMIDFFPPDFNKVVKSIRKLTPAIEFIVQERVGNTILALEIIGIVLTRYTNDDPKIKCVDGYIQFHETPRGQQ